MKILFITAHPYLPQMQGGLQSSSNQLCYSLINRGHEVAVLSALMADGWLGWKSRIKMQVNKKLFGGKVARDMGLAYPVWRAWYPWEAVEYVAAAEKPDLIVVMAVKPVLMAKAAQPTKIPILLMLQDVEFSQHGGRFEDLGDMPSVANSKFTAKKYHDAYGINPTVIYPFIIVEKYRTQTTKQNVTFINPVPVKGRDIAVEIARLCPDIPFTFIETWPLSSEQRSELMQKIATLSNVTLLPPQIDMHPVYGQCKILLAPSTWEEGYGRVATEAQISSIPVVGSTRGGLPEAIGPGGIVLDPEAPIENWANAVRKLWQDDKYYAELSAAAYAHAQRPEMDFPGQLDLWEHVLSAASNDPKYTKL